MHTQPNAHVFWNVGGIQSTWKKPTHAQEQRVDTHIKARKLVPCTLLFGSNCANDSHLITTIMVLFRGKSQNLPSMNQNRVKGTERN